MRKLFIVLLLLLSTSCTDEVGAKELLEEEGYTDISLTGYSFQCLPSEKIRTGFTATDSKGVKREGAVCCTIFCSIRTTDSFFLNWRIICFRKLN